jgi:hypothetical protein
VHTGRVAEGGAHNPHGEAHNLRNRLHTGSQKEVLVFDIASGKKLVSFKNPAGTTHRTSFANPSLAIRRDIGSFLVFCRG